MKWWSADVIPRLLFLSTLFVVVSGVAYIWFQTRTIRLTRQSELTEVVTVASPRPANRGGDGATGSRLEQGSASQLVEERNLNGSPAPTSESNSATVTNTPGFFAQLVGGINRLAQLVVGERASLSYLGGAAITGGINASNLEGASWASPLILGASAPNAAVFSNVTINSALAAKGSVTFSQLKDGFLRVNGVGEVTASRISLSSSTDVADRLPTASGGTGNDFSSTAKGSLVTFSQTGQMSIIEPGTSGFVLTSQGAGAVPTWTSVSSSAVDWANPGAIGATTRNSGLFSTLGVGGSSQLQVDNNGRLTLAYVGDSGFLSSSGGAIFLNQTNNLGTGIGIYSNAGASALGNMINVKVDNPAFTQAAFYMNYDGQSNAVEIVSNSTSSASNALAVTGNNINDSTVGIIGYELGRGTVKITHNRPGTGNDQNASGLSIDLKGVGTRAQGVYVDSTETGGTLGNLLRLRNETIDRFVVNYQGNLTMAGNLTQGANGTNTTLTKFGNVAGDEFFVGTNGAFRVQRSAGNSEAFRVQVNGDSQGRWLGTSDGQLKWGPGNATQDVVLRRGSTGVLFLDGGIVMNNLNQARDTVIKGLFDNNLFYVNASTDRIGIGLSNPAASLHISENAGTLPTLIVNNNGTGDLLTASASGVTRFTVANDGHVRLSDGLTVGGNTTLNGQTYTWPGSQTSGFVLSTNGSGTLSWINPATLGTNFWQQNSGVLSPATLTDRLALGTTTPQGGTALFVQRNSANNALTILDQTGTGAIFTASNSGTTRFTIADTGAVTALGNITQGANGSNTTFTKFGNTAGDEFFIGTNGAGRFQRSAANSETLRMQVSGDTQGRLILTSDGRLSWGPGTAAQDVILRRGNTGVLFLDGAIVMNNLNQGLDTVIKGQLDSNLFYVNATTDQIGIGLSNPAAVLHINKNAGTLPTLLVNNTGTGPIFVASGSGTTRMVVTNSGDVGIGTANPGYRLTVVGGATSLASANWLHFGSAATLFGDGTSTTLDAPNAGGVLTFNTAGNARARITATGLMGIGTTSPAGRLDVQGGNGGNASLIINQTLGGDILTASSSGTTRFTIANSGNITALGNITQGANGSNTTFTKLGNTAGDEFFIGTNGVGRFQRSSSNSETLRMQVSGDTQGRLVLTSDGRLNWGPGNAAQDTTLRRTGTGVLTLDGSLIPGTDLTYNLGSTAARWSNVFSGNVGVGATAFGTSAANVLAIAGSTAPTTSITDGIQLFAVDVAGSHELRVRDEAGNVTTLSPHNFSLIPEGRSEDLAWAFYSERNGLAINADMTKALRLLEDLSGEQLVYLQDTRNGNTIQFFQPTDSVTSRLDRQQQMLASISDQVSVGESSWTFLNQVIFQARARFEQAVEFGRQVRFQASAIFEQAVTFQARIRVNRDTAGVFKVPAGATKVRVTFQQSFSQPPLVTLSAPQGLVGKYLLEEVTAEAFVVRLTQAQANELQLQWWAVEAEPGQATVQVLEGAVLGTEAQGSATSPSPSPAASPTPSTSPPATPSSVPPTGLTQPSPAVTPAPVITPSPEPVPSPTPSPLSSPTSTLAPTPVASPSSSPAP